MDPMDRLLAALTRLVDHAATAVLSHRDLHLSPGQTGPTTPSGPTGKPQTPGAFVVETDPSCRQAAAGPGTVEVGCAPASYPVPIAGGCLATSVTAGVLPGKPAVPVTHPSVVAPGDTAIQVSIDPTLPTGLYLGELLDQTGTMRRPFTIYLDGL